MGDEGSEETSGMDVAAAVWTLGIDEVTCLFVETVEACLLETSLAASEA